MTEFKESTNTTSAGTAAKFGAADINKVTKYLNGVTDAATVVIDSSTTIQNAKLHVASITNTGVVTLPTATTTLVGTGTTDTLTNKTFDNQLDIKAISAPASPSSGYVRVYPKAVDANNDRLFIKQKVNGATVEVQIS